MADSSAEDCVRPQRTVSFSAVAQEPLGLAEDLRRTLSSGNSFRQSLRCPRSMHVRFSDQAQLESVVEAQMTSTPRNGGLVPPLPSGANLGRKVTAALMSSMSIPGRQSLPLLPLDVPSHSARPSLDESEFAMVFADQLGEESKLPGVKETESGYSTPTEHSLPPKTPDVADWPVPMKDKREELLGAKCGTPVMSEGRRHFKRDSVEEISLVDYGKV